MLVAGKRDYFRALVDSVVGVDGDVVELGVGAGKSASMLCSALRELGCARHYWGLDSFCGFPEPTEEDAGSIKSLFKGYRREHWCSTPGEARERIVRDASYPPERLHFIPGYYCAEVFSRIPAQRPIAILHLDCDLFRSYSLGLSFFSPRVAPGGLIAFDEFGDPSKAGQWPGAEQAVEEWLDQAPPTFSRPKSIEWITRRGVRVRKYHVQTAEDCARNQDRGVTY